jgi:hypothetical protein
MGTLVAAVTRDALGLTDLRIPRERFEEELRAAVHARSVVLRDDPVALLSPPANAVCFDVPSPTGETRARIEVVFDVTRPLDGWTCQLIDGATHLAAIVLELERAAGRVAVPKRQTDGAAPLIASSEAIKRVRDRIARVAATDFTVLIEGAIGPEPHPDFIDLFGSAPLGDRPGALERAGDDGQETQPVELKGIDWRYRLPLAEARILVL